MEAIAGELFAPPRTYGRLRLNAAGAWEISDLEPHVSIRLKAVFPRVPKGSAGPFTLRRDEATDADLRWFMERYPLAVSPADAAAMERGQRSFFATQAEMERILLPSYRPSGYVGLRPGQAIRGYQAQAIEIAARSKGLLLGDECGLGKTFTAAGFCLGDGRLPAAIVCQVHIQKQWRHVVEQFTTLRVHAIKKTIPYSLPPADIYVFRYSQLAGWAEVFATGMFKTVIYDEPQELRGGTDTAKGKAAEVASQHAAWRLGLTATPIYNYGAEIFQIMRFINPEVLGDWADFRREYLSDRGRLLSPKALGTYLREQYAFLRRTKGEVGKELPAVNRIVDTVGYDEGEVRSIEALARQLAIRATTGAFVERGNAARELDIMVRQATGVAKARHVADVVRILVESGEPVVLMGWHRAVYDIWLDRLKDLKPAMYTGSESATQKNSAKEAFLAGQTDLLIMSLRSAAGLDGLQARCSTMVFGELDWSPGVHHQCIERLDREGQTQPVTALFLVADEGSDPPIMEMLGLKASEAHQVIDPALDLQPVANDESRLAALVQRYLHRRGAAPVEAEAMAA
ncbi:DEAD/DEAH box helicase [Falsiroseomonas sp.]|uniref:SNF2-related protein n=1 Tax=Falsiroseomonas sp. TaxID=2870721 RepID=UPI0027357CF5|nr:DEAD/DEAH box helicase [Falsiroseomonas sp.]MDP3417904.1 DEAD/DEAH box helicase [Falsiroseomonas sp.]